MFLAWQSYQQVLLAVVYRSLRVGLRSEPWQSRLGPWPNFRTNSNGSSAPLKAAGKAPDTVDTYVGRSHIFLRWLAADYVLR